MWSPHSKESHDCLRAGNRLHTKIVRIVIKFIKGANSVQVKANQHTRMQMHITGINSSNNEGVTKFRASWEKKCMKKGYDIGEFQRSGKISLHFWYLADLGDEIDYWELEHRYASRNDF